MPRTLDQIVQDILGEQLVVICRLRAELDATQAKLAELQAAADKPKDGV